MPKHRTVESNPDGWGIKWPPVGSFSWPRSLAFEPEAITTNGELRASLESWVRANEFKEIPWTAVPKALKKLGCESTKIGGTRGWRGVKVDFERDLDTSDGQDGKLVNEVDRVPRRLG
jgi:hypothetical protein